VGRTKSLKAALAAQNYPGDFCTAHSLFGIPVIEKQMRENSDDSLECSFLANAQRAELLQSTNVIIWDEFPANHRECFESVYPALNEFRGKVFNKQYSKYICLFLYVQIT
jgi:hypothetical protein